MMTVEWLGQSGYIVECGKTRIAIDPYLSDIVGELHGRPRTYPAPYQPNELCADAVICTHDHLDHLDPPTVEALGEAQYFITTNEGAEHIKKLGRKNVRPLNTGDTVQIGGMTVEAVFADHSTEAFGLLVSDGEKILYFTGDTLFNEKLFEIKQRRPDVLFICINGRLGNMNVGEAIQTANEIGAPVNIPNHYDMFSFNSEDPQKFVPFVKGGKILTVGKKIAIE